MYCNNCGKEILDNDKFCKHCGAKVISKDEIEKIEKQKEEKRKQDIEKMASTDTIIDMANDDNIFLGFWPQLIAVILFPFYAIVKCLIGLFAYKGKERSIYFKKLAKNLIKSFFIFTVIIAIIVGFVLFYAE